jgi:hypothetical protein
LLLVAFLDECNRKRTKPKARSVASHVECSWLIVYVQQRGLNDTPLLLAGLTAICWSGMAELVTTRIPHGRQKWRLSKISV